MKYRKRGRSGFGKRIALLEWSAAAMLWKEWITPVSGWTVDFGAGNGGFWELAERPAKLLLVDISSNYRRAAGENRIVADALYPPLHSDSVNCIVALGLIEYLKEPVEVFSIWRDVITDNGKLLISDSPPLVQNRLRRIVRLGVHPRKDDVIADALEIAGWMIHPSSPMRAGWQSLFVAHA